VNLRARLANLEQFMPRGAGPCKPGWCDMGADLSRIVLQIVTDLGLDLDECAAWVRIAGDGLEMTTNTQAILADADACAVASKLSARIAGP